MSDISKYKQTSIGKALISKLKKVRMKINEDNDIYISKLHKDVCDNFNKYNELLSLSNKKEEVIRFKYKDDNVDDIYSFYDDFSNNKKPSFFEKSYSYKSVYLTQNKKFINIINKNIDPDNIKDFLQEQSDYIQSLTLRELYNLKCYTIEETLLILEIWTRNRKNGKTNTIQTIDHLQELPIFPFFYQLRDYFKDHTESDDDFLDYIKYNYSSFSVDVFDIVIDAYIDEINNIILNAPKTKKELYVYKIDMDMYKNATSSSSYRITDEIVTTYLFPETLIKKYYPKRSVLYKIKIDVNLPVLFIDGIDLNKGNKENIMKVLLPLNSKIFIDTTSTKIKYFDDKNILCYDSSSKDVKPVKITTLMFFDVDNTKNSKEKILNSKLNSIRRKLENDKDEYEEFYLDEEHKSMCNYYNLYQELIKKVKVELKMVPFTIATDNINDRNQVSILSTLNENDKITFTDNVLEYPIEYNEYNHKFINKIQKFIDVEEIQSFLTEQSNFLKSLSVREIFNLKYYTQEAYKVIMNFIEGTFQVKQLTHDIIYKNTLFHFQFLDYFKKNPVFNDITVDTSNFKSFHSFIQSNYLKFTIDIYNEIIQKFIEEINEIFKKAPRIKKELFVYRGVQDNYISAEVIKNKTRGYFTTDRFTSTSLFANKIMSFLDEKKGVLYEIKLEKGVPVIFLEGITFHPLEYEVLLPIGAKLFIDYANKKQKYYMNMNLICEDKDRRDSNTININMTSLVYFE